MRFTKPPAVEWLCCFLQNIFVAFLRTQYLSGEQPSQDGFISLLPLSVLQYCFKGPRFCSVVHGLYEEPSSGGAAGIRTHFKANKEHFQSELPYTKQEIAPSYLHNSTYSIFYFFQIQLKSLQEHFYNLSCHFVAIHNQYLLNGRGLQS